MPKEVKDKVTTKKAPSTKTVIAKTAAKVTKPKTEKVVEVKPKTVKKATGLSVAVYSLAGKEVSTLNLPAEVFGAKVNKELLSQALRVYSSNQKTHWGNTKTRGEIQGSTRKIWKQKGTGRARHGSITAPIFVGGGIALGPRTRITSLDLPKKMKRAALVSAFSQKLQDSQITAIQDLDKATGKTKEIANLLKVLNKKSAPIISGSVLIIGEESQLNVLRSVKNLPKVDFSTAFKVNTYDLIAHKNLILTAGAVQKLQERILGSRVESLESSVAKGGQN